MLNSEYSSNLRKNLVKVSILYLIFISSFFVSINIGMLVFLLVASLFMLFTEKTVNTLGIYFAILPLSNLIILNGDYDKSYFFLLTFILIGRLIIFQKIKLSLLFSYLFFSLYVVVASGYNGGLSFTALLTIINYFPFVFFCSKYTISDFKNIILTGTFGFLCSSIIGIFKSSIPFLTYILRSSTVLIGGYDTGRFSGLAYDTNYYGVWCVFLISLLSILTLKIKFKYEKYIFFLLIGIITILGLLTYSKAFVLTLAFLFVFYLIFAIHLNPLKLSAILAILAIFNKMLIVIMDFSIKEFIESRFIEKATNLSSLTTHRNLLWKEYLDYSFSSIEKLLFGAGMNNPVISRQVAHNFYIEVFYLIGLIGLLLFVSYFILFYMSLRKIGKTKVSIYQYAPLLSFLIIAFSLNFFSVNETFMYLYLSIMCCTLNLKEDTEFGVSINNNTGV